MIYFHDHQLALGFIIQCASSISFTFADIIDSGCYAGGITFGPTRSTRKTEFQPSDLDDAIALANDFPVVVALIMPRASSLCRQSQSLARSGIDLDRERELVVDRLNTDLEFAAKFGGMLVVDPGTHVQYERGIRVILQTIEDLHFQRGTRLLIRNALRRKHGLCTTFKQLGNTLRSIHPTNRPFVGVALDLAAVFANGDSRLDSADSVMHMFDQFEAAIGRNACCVLLLHDTLTNFNSAKTDPTCLCQGNIWRNCDTLDPLYAILTFAIARDLPILTHCELDVYFIETMLG